MDLRQPVGRLPEAMEDAPEPVGTGLNWEETEYGDPDFTEQWINATDQNPALSALSNQTVGLQAHGAYNYPDVPQELQDVTGSSDFGSDLIPPHPHHLADLLQSLDGQQGTVAGRDELRIIAGSPWAGGITSPNLFAQGRIPLLVPSTPLQAGHLPLWDPIAPAPLVQQGGSDLNTSSQGVLGDGTDILAGNCDPASTDIFNANPFEQRPQPQNTTQLAAHNDEAYVPTGRTVSKSAGPKFKHTLNGQSERQAKRHKGNNAPTKHGAPSSQRLAPALYMRAPSTPAPRLPRRSSGVNAMMSQAVVNGDPEAYFFGKKSGLPPGHASFPCLEDDCGKSFKTESQLRRHEKRHDLRFDCPVHERDPGRCHNNHGKGFEEMRAVDRHVLTHSPPQFHCRHACGLYFARCENRSRHEKTCKARPLGQTALPTGTTSYSGSLFNSSAALAPPANGELLGLSQMMHVPVPATGLENTTAQPPVTPIRRMNHSRSFTRGRPTSTRASHSIAAPSLGRSEPSAMFSMPPGGTQSTPLTMHTPSDFAPGVGQGSPSDNRKHQPYFPGRSHPK